MGGWGGVGGKAGWGGGHACVHVCEREVGGGGSYWGGL